MKLLKLFTSLAVLTFFISACNQTTPNNSVAEKANTNVGNTTVAQPSATLDELASGRSIYKNSCSKCHKDDGSGGEVEIDGLKLKADDLTSEKIKKMDDQKYVKIITNGIIDEGMPSFENKLSEKEILEVIKFVRSELQK